MLAAAISFAAAGTALAQDAGGAVAPAVAAPMPDSLSEAVLPYSPYLFDLAVSSLRTVVAITYDTRAYDPVRRNFVVAGLRLHRGPFDARVAQLRLGPSATLLQGLEVDTRRLPVDPEFRDALRRLDSEVVRGDVYLAADFFANADLTVAASLDFDRIGRADLEAELKGFHILAPLGEAAGIGGDQPEVLGSLGRVRFTYEDAGLAKPLFEAIGREQNMGGEQMQATAAALARPLLAGYVAGLPGGVSPEFVRRADGWGEVAGRFLGDPKRIELLLEPAEPVPLDLLKDGAVDEAVLVRLNPTVATEPIGRTALVDPDAVPDAGGSVPLARRLVDGLGVPRDVGRGVALALADTAAGKPGASEIAVDGMIADPAASLTAANAADAYVILTLARTRGRIVPDAVLARATAFLPGQALAEAEAQALAEWRGSEAGRVSEAEETRAIAARDWRALRKLAFDHYDGTRRPLSMVRAFALADVAAAGGDRLAASLRDDLTLAAGDRRLALPLDAARQEAAELWRRVLAAKAP
ncbi:hypothetical protein F6X38_02075 [Aureimonas leprariae]|uniref:Uncharacterized protein n=2 Tax=Plantimonas leprariae TaxID=2615207 RepID=A0A7V7TY75_9HYPH|nr:hypothetical protein F6X38_02075 [Aureimonas leprariae]